MFRDNALALLGVDSPAGHVGGMDFVGAAAAHPSFQLSPQAMQSFAQAMQHRQAPVAYRPAPYQDDSKFRTLQQLAMANFVPQIKLGIGSDPAGAKVKAAASASFSPEGSVPLRITQFTVASSIAPFFVITQLTVARLNLLAGAVAVPAEDFIPNARHAPLEIPILAAGSQVVVGVTNVDAADHFFFASVTAIDLTSASARMIP
jgi:hypothetical protein